jgi:hypothetical protein
MIVVASNWSSEAVVEEQHKKEQEGNLYASYM